jgi:AcrR family transcriptional regulator
MLAALPPLIAEHGFARTTVAQIVKAAKVRRNAFYEQFESKRDCFATAYELAQERLLGVFTFRCYTRAEPAERIEAALAAGLELLASEPAMARLLVEAPAVGGEILTRHHEWLERYGRMIRLARIGADGGQRGNREIEAAIAGGIATQVGRLVLEGKAERLADLGPSMTAYALSFVASGDDFPPAQPQSSSSGGAGAE